MIARTLLFVIQSRLVVSAGPVDDGLDFNKGGSLPMSLLENKEKLAHLDEIISQFKGLD